MDAATGRRDGRKRVLMTATIITIDGPAMAKILDLSPSGVRIASNMQLSPDRDVIFRRGQAFVAARVAWTEQTLAGLDFYRQIDPAAFGET